MLKALPGAKSVVSIHWNSSRRYNAIKNNVQNYKCSSEFTQSFVYVYRSGQVRCYLLSTVRKLNERAFSGQFGSIIDSHLQPVFHVYSCTQCLFGHLLDLDPGIAPMIIAFSRLAPSQHVI